VSRTFLIGIQVSECGPRVIEIGSGRMGALSDYICKSNEAVDKMVEIYIYIYIHTYIYIYIYTHTRIHIRDTYPRART
jgi:hypothetical protein